MIYNDEMRFFDLFPTPKYLSLSEAGVCVSENEIRFISFHYGKPGNLSIHKHGVIPLPAGVISGGAVADKAGLTASLQKLKAQGFKYVSVSLPEEKGYLFTTQVDKVPYKDLYDAVAFTVEENVPVSLKDSVFSFETQLKPDKIKVAVSVMPIDVVKGYVDAFEAAGIKVVSIDTEPQAIARALITRGDERSHLLINLSSTKAGFYIIDDEIVHFSSTIPTDLTNPEAVASLKVEIRKFFVFWNTRLEPDGASRKIDKVILCGEGSRDDAFVANIMSEVETPYSLGSVWTNVCAIEEKMPEIPFDESLSYAAGIGSALPPSKHTYV